MFKYFKGEEENPFDNDTQNTQYQFWGYERTFDTQFNSQNFTQDFWVSEHAFDINEWKAVLKRIPVNKEELFKLWLFTLLMDHLPDKYLSDHDKFLRLYYDTHIDDRTSTS